MCPARRVERSYDMKPKKIHLNTNMLHQDVEKIRQKRSQITGDMEIQLIWGENDEHTIRVIANGPNLWVTGYYHQDGTFIRFDEYGGPGVLRYNGRDVGCEFTLAVIAKTLGPLVGISEDSNPFPRDFRTQDGNEEARAAYVMCVFLASEMIRNELLERALLLGMRKPDVRPKWNDYVLLYKNWATVSKILYRIESGDNYPIIYAADAKSMFSRLEAAGGEGRLTPTELEVYRGLINNPQIV